MAKTIRNAALGVRAKIPGASNSEITAPKRMWLTERILSRRRLICSFKWSWIWPCSFGFENSPSIARCHTAFCSSVNRTAMLALLILPTLLFQTRSMGLAKASADAPFANNVTLGAMTTRCRPDAPPIKGDRPSELAVQHALEHVERYSKLPVEIRQRDAANAILELRLMSTVTKDDLQNASQHFVQHGHRDYASTEREFLALALQPGQPIGVVMAALDVVRNVYDGPPDGNAVGLPQAVIRAMNAHEYDLAITYATGLTVLGEAWSGAEPLLQNAVDDAVSLREPISDQLIACLASGIVAIAPSRGLEYLTTRILAPRPVLTAVNSAGRGPLADRAVREPRTGQRRIKSVPSLGREAAAIAVIELPHMSAATLVTAIEPVLLADENTPFIADDKFASAILSLDRDGGIASPLAVASFLSLGAKYVSMPGNLGEREKVGGEFRTEFREFTEIKPPVRDRALLESVGAAAATFNAAVSDRNNHFGGRRGVSLADLNRLILESRIGYIAPIISSFDNNSKAAAFVHALSAPVALILLWMTVLRFAPLWLLRREIVLVQMRDGEVPFVSKALKGVMWFGLHSRYVQDRWVDAYLALRCADPILNLADSMVPLPLDYRPQLSQLFQEISSLEPAHVRDMAPTGRLRVLIIGEGGIGKSTVCAYIAGLLQHPDKVVRPLPYKCVAITLASDIDPSTSSEADVVSAIRSRLDDIVRDKLPLNDSFVSDALKAGRIGLIVDGMSEFSTPCSSAVKTFLTKSAPRVVIVTSRCETVVRSHFGVTLRPHRIETSGPLRSFLKEYCLKLGVALPGSATTESIANGVRRVSGDRTTPLLIWLYLQMRDSPNFSEPTSATGLMERYLEVLNGRISPPDKIPTDDVLSAARSIAMACCVSSKLYRASPVEISSVRSGGTSDDRIAYLIERLSVLTRDPYARIMFTIDPLCEYLAALHLLALIQSDYDAAFRTLDWNVDDDQRLALAEFVVRLEETALAFREAPSRTPAERSVTERFLTDLNLLRQKISTGETE